MPCLVSGAVSLRLARCRYTPLASAVTFYKSANDLAAFSDYRIKGRMYRYFEGEPLFPFGFGLSYTSFAYRNLTLPKQAKAGEQLQISVDVGNTGGMAGERFDVAPRELPTVGTDGRTVAKPGAFEIWAGGKQPGFRGLADAATSGILSGKFTIGGTAKELD